MKKRILSLVAALALAATVVAPVSASDAYNSSKKTVRYNAAGTAVDASTAVAEGDYVQVAGKTVAEYKGGKIVINEGNLSTVTKDELTPAFEDGWKTSDLKLSGVAATAPAATTTVANFTSTNSQTVTIGTLGGDNKDNIHDNGINPAIKEFAKVTAKRALGDAQSGKAALNDVQGVMFFELKGAQTGDMTIKLPDGLANSFDNYSIVLHYTGNASDEDGITAQYVKVSAGGKLTAHFNSYSPVAIIATNAGSAQTLVNTYNHAIGSDEIGAAAATTTTTTVATPVDATATTATTDDNAGNGTKTAASPKTGDNAYALYLILAVAAVAGTTLVATKKTR